MQLLPVFGYCSSRNVISFIIESFSPIYHQIRGFLLLSPSTIVCNTLLTSLLLTSSPESVAIPSEKKYLSGEYPEFGLNGFAVGDPGYG
jgi:hypothetical protein